MPAVMIDFRPCGFGASGGLFPEVRIGLVRVCVADANVARRVVILEDRLILAEAKLREYEARMTKMLSDLAAIRRFFSSPDRSADKHP